MHESGHLLPEPVRGVLRSTAIAAAAAGEGDHASGLPDEVEYLAFESGDRRFAWTHTPATVEGEGAQFFFLSLLRTGDGWDFMDIDPHDSPEDAWRAAAEAWIQAEGLPELPTEPVPDH